METNEPTGYEQRNLKHTKTFFSHHLQSEADSDNNFAHVVTTTLCPKNVLIIKGIDIIGIDIKGIKGSVVTFFRCGG